MPPTVPGHTGSSAKDWTNDFLRDKNGVVWVVNGTWTQDGKILFRDQRYTPEQFRQMLAEAGIPKQTPISILQEPRAEFPPNECGKFLSEGYKSFRVLSLPKKYWRWWRMAHGQPLTAASAG